MLQAMHSVFWLQLCCFINSFILLTNSSFSVVLGIFSSKIDRDGQQTTVWTAKYRLLFFFWCQTQMPEPESPSVIPTIIHFVNLIKYFMNFNSYL